MSREVKILAFAGSTRAASWNKKLAAAAAVAAREAGAEVTLIDLRDFPLPLYDGDLESGEGLPAPALELKSLFKAHRGLLIASPEYNGGYSGVLKNSIDWVSRPNGEEAGLVPYKAKVAGIMATSPGRLGGLRGLAMIRQILTNLGVLVIPQQLAVHQAAEAFASDGSLADSAQQAALAGIAARVVDISTRLPAD